MTGPDDIRAAYARIKPHVRRTPVIRTGAADFGVTLSSPLTLKLEFLQHTGTFKPRGAFNNLLSRAVPAAGVAAASGGNHGAAAAYAAQKLGHKATIFVPDVSSPVKIARIKSYGADARVGGARYADALDACNAFIETERRAVGARLRRGGNDRRPRHCRPRMGRRRERSRHRAGRGRRRRTDRRHRGVVRAAREGRRRRAGRLARAACLARSGQAGRCDGGKHRGGFAGRAQHRATRLRHRESRTSITSRWCPTTRSCRRSACCGTACASRPSPAAQPRSRR